MYNEFLNNVPQQKIFHNKSTKIIRSMKKKIIMKQNKKRKCHSYDNNEEQIQIKLNISNNNDFPLSESFSAIYSQKEDFKNKIVNEQNNDMSFNLKKNSFKNDSIFIEDSPKIKKISSSLSINASKKLENLRKHFLNDVDEKEIENKNDEIIQKDKTKIKRPNYLIKSCFYNNNDSTQKQFFRSLSKKESSSPVLDFYINNNGNVLKKYYKHSTFGKVNNKKLDMADNKDKKENDIKFENDKVKTNKYISNKNNNHHHHHFLNNNEESFIKIIQADSSDDENRELNLFLDGKNDFANEIDIINKIKDKEDTLSNLINISFKSQIIEKQNNNLNESMHMKHNNSINFSQQNISEALSNSINSNRSLNEEFVFKNHSKIFQNHNRSLSVNNSMNKNQEDKINNENILNKSDKQNIINYIKNDINNNNQKINNDFEDDEIESNQYNNDINIIEENNFNNKHYFKSNQNEEMNDYYRNQNNNNNKNIILNPINNINNNKNNKEINQFFPQINPNNLNNINNINNINFLPNPNYLYINKNNSNINPYINNTINFIYNNNMNLIYNNPLSINSNDFNQPNINNNNYFVYNNNTNINCPNQFNNYNFSNTFNPMINKNMLNNNIFNNNNFINNNFNNNNYLQNNNSNIYNKINKNNYITSKQHKHINSNNNNIINFKNNQKINDFTKMSNEELAKEAHIIAKTQEGSRFLEKVIESNPIIVQNLFFPCTLPYFEELSNNKYGNFYIKKLIKNLPKEYLGKLIEFLYPMISKIGTNQYGSKILEQLIKSIKDDDILLFFFIKEILPHMILLINDLNGTHIIYKLLLLKSKYIKLIEEHIYNNIKNIYITREGSNLLKKYFDIINKEGNNLKNYDKIVFFINTINNNLPDIIIDQFGNYIIRHIVLNLNHSFNNILIQNIIKNIVYYSNQKYSSNVVENCLDNNFIKEYILNELTKQYIFNNIFLNEYGNYVIQKAIGLADEAKKDIYFKYIVQVSRQLQTLQFGPKLLSKLLMLYPKLSMYMLTFINNCL